MIYKQVLEIDLRLESDVIGIIFFVVSGGRNATAGVGVGAATVSVHKRHFQLGIWDVTQANADLIDTVIRSIRGEFASTIRVLPADKWYEFLLIGEDVTIAGLDVTA